MYASIIAPTINPTPVPIPAQRTFPVIAILRAAPAAVPNIKPRPVKGIFL